MLKKMGLFGIFFTNVELKPGDDDVMRCDNDLITLPPSYDLLLNCF